MSSHDPSTSGTRRSARLTVVPVVLALLLGLCGVAFPAPASANPGPWTWVKATASGTTTGQGAFVAAVCPAGYRALAGGISYGDVISSSQVIDQVYRAQAFDYGNHTRLDVTAWCAPVDSVDVEIDDRTLRTDREGQFGVGLGVGDFACSGDRTPVSASTTWTTSGAEYSLLTQSGPEIIGGVVQWFVTAEGATTASVLDVKLTCVANSDLPSTSWITQSLATGQGGTLTATCPDGQRLLTGGEHVDSIVADAYSNTPVDSRTWSATAYVPAGDTLTVSVLCIPAGDPVATITSAPPRAIATTSATFTFDAVDPSGGTAHDYCFLNTSGLGPCAGSLTVTGLTEGQNVFSIEAYTDDGRGWAPTEKDYYFWVDLTAPTVTLAKPALFTLGGTVALQATGADNQGVDHYRYAVVARPTSGSGAGTADPVGHAYTSADGRLSLKVAAGTTYRVATKAVDAAGNASAAATADTAVPLDNLALTASSQWTLVKGAVYTNKLVSRTAAKGATLSVPLYGDVLGVVATTCPACGKVGVYSGSTLVRTIDLHATTTHYQQVTAIRLGTSAVQTTVTLKVLSTNQRVEIDGLGAAIA